MSTLQDPAGAGAANVVDAVTPGSLVGKKAVLVTLASATVVVSDAAEGAPGAAAPVAAIQIGGTDGTNLVVPRMKAASTAAVATDPAFMVAVSPNNTPVLPSGAATSALQTQPGVDIGDVTINNGGGGAAVNIQDGGNSLTVDGTVAVSGSVAVTGPLTDTQLRASAVPITVNNGGGGAAVNVQDGGNSLTVDGTFWQATQPVSAASLPLPAGAATETTLSAASGKLPASLGQKAMAASLAVVVASDQEALPTQAARAATSATSNVASSASNVTLLASNAARLGATVFNDSNQNLFLKLGATSSLTSFTARLTPNAYYEVPGGYTGIITGIWAVANGSAHVTELTA
jgi:hypothetical protein